MSLFELNARLAVKLGQSLETLYNLEYFEYSMLFNVIKKDIEDANSEGSDDILNLPPSTPSGPLLVNLPDHLRLK